MQASDSMENAVAQNNLHREIVNSKSLEGKKLLTEEPAARQLNRETTNLVKSSEFTDVMLPISLLLTAGMLIVLRIVHKKGQNVANEFLTHFNQLPCMNCHFFYMNQHLNCAVNPSVVLTDKAVNCLDYRPGNRKSL